MIIRPTFRLHFHPLPIQRRSVATAYSRARVDGKPIRLRGMKRKTTDPEIRQKRHHQKKFLESIGARFTGDKKSKLAEETSALAQSQSVDPTPEKANELYMVERTHTGNLPVYQLRKRGGNLLQTRIRRVDGKRDVLEKQLWEFLVPKPEWLKVNAVNGHIEMKGFYKEQIDRFLLSKGF